jgi:hypothetical protein
MQYLYLDLLTTALYIFLFFYFEEKVQLYCLRVYCTYYPK